MSRRSEHRHQATAATEVAALADLTRPSVFSSLLQWLPFDLVQPLAIVADLAIILVASLASAASYQLLVLHEPLHLRIPAALAILVAANFCTFTATQQNYTPLNLSNFGRQIRYVTLDWLIIVALLTLVAFALKIADNFSRGETLSFFVLGWLSLTIFRAVLSDALTKALRSGSFSQQNYVLISQAGQVLDLPALSELHQCGYRPAKMFEVEENELASDESCDVLAGKIGDVILENTGSPVDSVYLVMNWDRPQHIERMLKALRVLPVQVHLLPDKDVGRFLLGKVDGLGPAFSIELQRSPLTRIERVVKRIVDIVIAATMVILLLPILAMTALLIKFDSKGPVLFRQRRNGFCGNPFYIYKFRSMRVLQDGGHVPQATRDDPRVTRIGRWLRQTSIDELPQLFNVLKGEMSLVGPRPHAVAHNDHYRTIVANYASRHHVKPGITGWAQVNGLRGETPTLDSMAKRVEYDLWYVDHWSLWLDIKILLKTLLLAYRQPTAY